MMDLEQSWRSVNEWVDGLPLRQRALMFALGLALVYGLVYGLLIGPLQRRESALSAALQAVEKQTQTTGEQLRHFVNPQAHARALTRVKTLEAQVKGLRAHLSNLTGGLVAPRDMTQLVRHVLRRSPGVMVVRLQNLPPVAIAPQTRGAPVLYRHTLIVVIRGRYVPLVAYLHRLAHQRQRVLWGPFRLKVGRYPFSTLSLHLYTLSLRRALLR